ncbi:MAG TPA: pyridoxamine 5'-phosphate oxidase family protein [Acidimicrobiia bacterium]|jgi:nitroimidazol reductase NimA-like FMN-containing flavoprotein (pyridoxamine 5'-phosphate oxidase superfamily)
MPGHIPFSKVDAWLRATRSMWIATVRPDQRPHLVPLWFYWDGRAIYFDTGIKTVKRRNLSNNDRVMAHVGDGDDPIIIVGQARRVSDSDEISRVDQAFRAKYVDPNSGAAAGYPETDQDLAYRIDIERIMAWEYGTVATRTDFLLNGISWQGVTPERI